MKGKHVFDEAKLLKFTFSFNISGEYSVHACFSGVLQDLEGIYRAFFSGFVTRRKG